MNEQLRQHLSELGRKGGKASGPRKARTREQAQKAALARWKRPGPTSVPLDNTKDECPE